MRLQRNRNSTGELARTADGQYKQQSNRGKKRNCPRDLALGSSGQGCVAAEADRRHGHGVLQPPATSSAAAHLEGSIGGRGPRRAVPCCLHRPTTQGSLNAASSRAATSPLTAWGQTLPNAKPCLVQFPPEPWELGAACTSHSSPAPPASPLLLLSGQLLW